MKTPPQVEAAVQEYREESDVVGRFIEECCDVDTGYEIRAGDLYAAYVAWCKAENEHTISGQMFGRRLTDRGCPVEKRGGAKFRKGIRLR